MILIQSWPPHLVLAPLAQVDPPFMPWRDAGYSQADFTITLQDCVYGLWRAKEAGLISIKDGFNLEESTLLFNLELIEDMRSTNVWKMAISIGLHSTSSPLHRLSTRILTRKCRLVHQWILFFLDHAHHHQVVHFLVRFGMFCISLQHIELALLFV